MKKTVLVAVLPALLGASLFHVGCKKASEKVSEKIIEKSMRNSGAQDAKVDIAKGKVSYKTEQGAVEVSTGESAALPADLPKDVCVIKGAKVQTAVKTPEGFMIQMSVAQDRAKVAEAYSSDMKAQGWAQESAMDMDNMSSRSFKKDKRQVALVVSQSGSSSDVMLTMTAEK